MDGEIPLATHPSRDRLQGFRRWRGLFLPPLDQRSCGVGRGWRYFHAL